MGFLPSIIFTIVAVFAIARPEFRSIMSSEKTDFKDQWTSEHIVGLRTGESRVSCLSDCLNLDICESFFYHEGSKACQLQNGTLYNTSLTESSPGWTYHQLYSENCPLDQGFIFYKPMWKCYKTYPEVLPMLNVTRINETCHNDSAEVISIKSQEEQQFYGQVASGIVTTEVFYMILIQGSDDEEEGIWRLNDGTEMTYFHWNSWQPDNDTQQNILAMFALAEWKWHDLLYNDGFQCVIICEKII